MSVSERARVLIEAKRLALEKEREARRIELKGERGETGPVGPQGVQGEIGPSGGVPGTNGERGLPGEPGTNGVDGLPGPVGPMGERGHRGAEGERGLQGEIGPQGERGLRGARGVQGDRGEIGPQGIQGLDGDRGRDGTPGKKGEPGIVWRGAWVQHVSYVAGDVVEHDGSSWVAKFDNSKSLPARNVLDWDLMAERGGNGAAGGSSEGGGGASTEVTDALDVRIDALEAAPDLTDDVLAVAAEVDALDIRIDDLEAVPDPAIVTDALDVRIDALESEFPITAVYELNGAEAGSVVVNASARSLRRQDGELIAIGSGGAIYFNGAFSYVERYDAGTGAWTQIPLYTSDVGLVAYYSAIYLPGSNAVLFAGGESQVDAGGGIFPSTAQCWKLNLTNNTFSQVASLPVGLELTKLMLVASTGAVLAFGGYGQATPGVYTVEDAVYSLNSALTTWTAKTPMPWAAELPGVVQFEAGQFLVGSSADTESAEYLAGSDTWSAPIAMPLSEDPLGGVLIPETGFGVQFATGFYLYSPGSPSTYTALAAPDGPGAGALQTLFAFDDGRIFVAGNGSYQEYLSYRDEWTAYLATAYGSEDQTLLSNNTFLMPGYFENSGGLAADFHVEVLSLVEGAATKRVDAEGTHTLITGRTLTTVGDPAAVLSETTGPGKVFRWKHDGSTVAELARDGGFLVTGLVESLAGGFKFPDDTIQTSAAEPQDLTPLEDALDDEIADRIAADALLSPKSNPSFTGTLAAVIVAASGNVSGANLSGNQSGTNTGDLTLAAVGSSPNANGATLAAQVLNLQPADATNPGVVTTGTQTFAGLKTLSSKLTISVGSGVAQQLTAGAKISFGAVEIWETGSTFNCNAGGIFGSSLTASGLYRNANGTLNISANGTASTFNASTTPAVLLEAGNTMVNATDHVLQVRQGGVTVFSIQKDGVVTFAGANTYKGLAGITAFAGGGQASATALAAEVSFVDTAASGGDSVKLPTAILGKRMVVYNDGANAIDIFPTTGGAIDGLGTNNAYSLAAGASREFWGKSATLWKSR